jgi:mannitol/fructose-specific phosphotransferase system IIA component (Ntr-type)
VTNKTKTYSVKEWQDTYITISLIIMKNGIEIKELNLPVHTKHIWIVLKISHANSTQLSELPTL